LDVELNVSKIRIAASGQAIAMLENLMAALSAGAIMTV
jgi:hypothetical protein